MLLRLKIIWGNFVNVLAGLAKTDEAALQQVKI
jgi:hypothetical protein